MDDVGPHESRLGSVTSALKRSRLIASLSTLSPEMRTHLRERKSRGKQLRARPDLLWHLLLLSAATQGNSRGWLNLRADTETLATVSYDALAPLGSTTRKKRILAALRKAKVRMPTIKASRLARNVVLIAEMGGIEVATKRMLNLPSRDAKLQFMRSFHGIGEKYGRNVWMDIYDPDFRDTVAVDERIKKVARALGFEHKRYRDTERFFCDIAREAGLEPWELDRLLYNFTDHFLAAVQLPKAKADCYAA